ncbi:hypothetical protein HPB50_013531 [Hyalomma asiaticum]|uniref:Uncharacterized protein n=1 Tax=Hyalomma asiaticum TaxID=266040 RepID=A0ACB7RJ57_HYAAI|nr:hypothetical protein HPB50_013531 [Hyalomma asiaticum]
MAEGRRPHNPHGPLQDEVIRLLHTPRPRCKGFFADLPPEERSKYIIPLPPEDDGAERVWDGAASETMDHGGQRGYTSMAPETTEGRQIRGRHRAISSQIRGATG